MFDILNNNKFNIIQLEQVDSTQSYCKQLDKTKFLEEFTVIYTTNQTSGRGQQKHKWESEKNKNISFTLLLRPTFLKVQQQYMITKIISLSIVDCLQKYVNTEIKIKWPNDIYINKNKICGILSEAVISHNKLSELFVGIGININQEKFVFAPNPTSLFLETNQEYDLTLILNDVLESIALWYNKLKANHIDEINQKYLSLLLFKDELHDYLFKSKRIQAIIRDVNPFGHLIFETIDGKQDTAELNQLQFIL